MWNGKGRSTQHELTYHIDDPEELMTHMHDIDGVPRQLEAFLAAAAVWRDGGSLEGDAAAEVAKGAPEQGMLDLAIMEAMLRSAEEGAAVPVCAPGGTNGAEKSVCAMEGAKMGGGVHVSGLGEAAE